MRNIERAVMLRAIDILWMDHLDQMEHLRDSVRLRAYGQRDPLVEYKNEGIRLFRELQGAIRSQIVSTIFKVGGTVRPAISEKIIETKPEVLGISDRADSVSGVPNSESGIANKGSKPEVGRNDPCPCGSGKKYKRCHMTQE